jgi:ABC-type glycerol-3-phosphate transport system substrate-binding protein
MRSLLGKLVLLSSTALVALPLTAVPAPAQDKPVVKVLMIGYPDEDSTDPTTGAPVPGIGRLHDAFEAAHPEIDLEIINIPWGEGASSYSTKTEAMIQANEACLYEMPAAPAYGRRGLLVNLDDMIKADPDFKNVWGAQLDTARSWGPDNPKSLFYIPDNTGERVVHWDAKLFKDWGVDPLPEKPTLADIEARAPKLTGTDPVTGEQTYGYWYQGKYAVWQFMAIAHAMGANWGTMDEKGNLTVNWDTPEYLKALEWFVKMSKYAPAGALGGDGMPQGFLTDQNVVAIIPEGEAGYFLGPMVADPALNDRFRVTYNFKGPDGLGGLNSVSPLAMAASCETKDAAWTALKWLAGAPEAEAWYFESNGRLPTTEDAAAALPQISKLQDGGAILGQPLTADAVYPWASTQPRWSLQAALEAAIAGVATPAEALKQAQAETADWLTQQAAGQ